MNDKYVSEEKNSWVANLSGISLLAFLLSGAIDWSGLSPALLIVLLTAALVLTALISSAVTYLFLRRKIRAANRMTSVEDLP